MFSKAYLDKDLFYISERPRAQSIIAPQWMDLTPGSASSTW